MALPTYDDIKALDFNYLTGNDLLMFCPSQILIKQYQVNNDSIETAVNTAYSEVKANLINRYDIETEFSETGTDRNMTVVKLTAIAAIRNITAELSGIPENMQQLFTWFESNMLAARNGQLSLYSLKQADSTINSTAEIVQNSFYTIG